MLLPGPLNTRMILLFGRGEDGSPDLESPYVHKGRTVFLFSSESCLRELSPAAVPHRLIACQIGDDEGFEVLLENLTLQSALGARFVAINPRDISAHHWQIDHVIDYLHTILRAGGTIPELN